MMKNIIPLFALFFLFTLPLCARNLIFINCSNLPISDQFYDRFASTGEFGLVSNNTAGGFGDLPSVMATINAGVKVTAKPAPNSVTPWDAFRLNGYMSEEGIGSGFYIDEFFEESKNLIILPSMEVMQNINTRYNNDRKIGRLIAALSANEKNPVFISVYGNSDTFTLKSRPLMLLLTGADEVEGDISGNCLESSVNAPGGFITNVDYIMNCIDSFPDISQFIVIDYGDGERLGAAEPSERDLYRIREGLNAVISGITKKFQNTDTTILLFSGRVNDPRAKNNATLAPVMLIDLSKNNKKGGNILTSNSTKRNGIITNLDITVFILDYFSAAHDGFMGCSVESIDVSKSHEDSLMFLREQNNRILTVNTTRYIVMTSFIALVVIISFISLYVIFSLRTVRSIRFMQWMLFTLLCLPLTIFVSIVFNCYTVVSSIIFCLISSLILGFALSLVKDVRVSLFIVGFVISLIILIDIMTGSTISKSSILGFDAIPGSRFYGLGNEMCGVLIGTTLLAIFSAIDLWGKISPFIITVTVMIFIAIVIAVGFPTIGTNFGGMITIASAYATAFYLLKDTKQWRKISLIAFAAAFLLLLGLIYINMRSGSTHIGRVFNMSLDDSQIIVQTALRKWMMNLSLMRYSNWTYLATSCLVIVLIFFFRTDRAGVRIIMQKHYYMKVGFIAMAIGAVIGLFVNDSGIVLSALTLLYLAVPIAIMVGDRCLKLATRGYYM